MRRHTLALAAAAVLVVGAPAAASAQTWTHTDPVGDVYHGGYDENTGTEVDAVDPTIAEADAVGTTIAHNPRKIVVTTRYRELTAPIQGYQAQYVALVKTDEKLRRLIGVTADSGHPSGVHAEQKPNGRNVRCRGLAHRIDYTANTVTITVPRSCVSRPRWIKVGAASLRMKAADDLSSFDLFIDDSHASGLGDDVRFSPRLRRG